MLILLSFITQYLLPKKQYNKPWAQIWTYYNLLEATLLTHSKSNIWELVSKATHIHKIVKGKKSYDYQ